MFEFDEWLPVENPGEMHIPAVVAVDKSGSMTGKPMEELNTGLQVLKSALEEDALALGRADLSIISFNDDAQIEVGFRPAVDYEPPCLQASGITAMNKAILMALDELEERKALYRDTGTKYFRPWLFLLTDGLPTDYELEDQARSALQKAIREKKVVFMPMAIGERASVKNLQSYYPEEEESKPVLQASAHDFSQAFVWLSNSIGIIGNSDPCSQDEALLQPLPDGITCIQIPIGS